MEKAYTFLKDKELLLKEAVSLYQIPPSILSNRDSIPKWLILDPILVYTYMYLIFKVCYNTFLL